MTFSGLTIPSITSRSRRPAHRVTAIFTLSHPVRLHIGHMNFPAPTRRVIVSLISGAFVHATVRKFKIDDV